MRIFHIGLHFFSANVNNSSEVDRYNPDEVDRYNPDEEDYYDLANRDDRKSLPGLVNQGI